jgi:hypothetical protein
MGDIFHTNRPAVSFSNRYYNNVLPGSSFLDMGSGWLGLVSESSTSSSKLVPARLVPITTSRLPLSNTPLLLESTGSSDSKEF